MASTLGIFRRAHAVAMFAAVCLRAAGPAAAASTTLTPQVLQCDGNFAAGSATSHPAPTVRVEERSATVGLKIGRRRLSVLPASTAALWRFDGNFSLTVSSCFANINGCPSGSECKTWSYTYEDPNGSAPLTTGFCAYSSATVTGCSIPATMTPLGTPHARAQLGACPSDPSGLPVTSSSFSITENVGPRPGATTLGLSSSALTLNGSSLFATALNSSSWDLPLVYTLSAWINASAADGLIVSQASASQAWGIGVGPGGGVRHFDSRDVTVGSDTERGSGLVGGWHLVHAVRKSGAPNSRRYYIDGRFVGNAPAASTTSFSGHPINTPLLIGRSSSSASFFNGVLDDVRILYVPLTDDDIMLEWDTQIHKFSSDSGITFSTFAGTYVGGAPANGTTGVVVYSTVAASPEEPFSATARWIFEAQNIDGESIVGASYGVTLDNSPPVAPSLSAVATSTNDITWSWGAPARVCGTPGSASVFYDLVDAAAGANVVSAISSTTFSIGENLPGLPNQLVGRKLRVTDTWGSGLNAATSAYTLANPPLADSVVPSAVSTGGATISWDQNGNPAYTRYLLSLSQDPTFATGVSTPTTLASDFTGNTVALASLAIGTTYHVRVQAFSGRSSDAFGGAGSVFVSTSFTTLPDAPGLSGLALSNTSIQWNWAAVPGAQYYTLFDGDNAILYTGSERSFTQGGLATNAQYTARVEAVSNNGAGARGSGTAFTLSNDPASPVVNAVNLSSITYSWNANLNPAYTFYEVTLTTSAAFALIIATVTVNATTATVNGLLPGTTYFARMRSINGDQLFGGHVVVAAARTLSDPAITTVLAPPSAYIPPGGSVGQWHFDEGTGVSAADSSGLGNAAFLTCTAASCVSTPTFIAGPAGLGSAVLFTGLNDGLVRVPDTPDYDFIDDLTVSAWVNPSSLSQPNGAGLVVRGSGTVENFALDVSGGLYRFAPKPGFVVSSTNSISMGTWTHLIGVYDSSAGSATLYVNGRLAATILSVPARTTADHDITIGNRQSAAAAYDRGFLGGIDAVRVARRAINAAEALAEYQGGLVSTVTPPTPNNGILIGLPPNAFSASATLFVSADPFTHPITITPAALNAGLTVIPTGFTLVPNSVVEVVAIIGGSPFTQTLGSEAILSIPYSDADGNNIIDDTSPPLAASAIKVYTLNTTVNRWEPLPTFVEPASRRVSAITPHFSAFAMFAPLTVATSLSQVRVYPIPWKPGSLTRFDAAGLAFDRLPASGTIRILNLAGERVREFSFEGSTAGSALWNGLTDGGRRAASGVYFARITAVDGSAALVKFAIER